MRDLSVVVFLLVLARAGGAQVPAPPDVLGIPAGAVLACHERPGGLQDSFVVAIEIIAVWPPDSTGARGLSIMASFDSSGVPIAARVMSTIDVDSLHERSEMVAGRLGNRPQGERLRGLNGAIDPAPALAGAESVTTPGASVLTLDDLRRLTILARWVWDHRCGPTEPAIPRPRPASPSPGAQ